MAFSSVYGKPTFLGGKTATPDPVTIKPVSSEAPSILKQAIEYYKPGGEFAGIRGEQLEAKRGTYTARAESQLVGRGLAGTTVGAAIPGAFEQEVATPWRTETEMFRGARLMEAILAQAGFSERQTAREQEVAIANAQMELQQRLADRQISVQEYNAATANLAARSRSAGGAGGVSGTQISSDIPRVYVPGVGTTTAGGAYDPGTKKDIGGYGTSYGGAGDSYGGIDPEAYRTPEGGISAAYEQAKIAAGGGFGNLKKIAEQWLTEPSVARGPL